MRCKAISQTCGGKRITKIFQSGKKW